MFKVGANDVVSYRGTVFDRQLRTSIAGVRAMAGDVIFWDNSGGLSVYEMREPTAGQWTTITATNRGHVPITIIPQNPSLVFLSGERWYYTQSVSGLVMNFSIPE